MNGPCSDKNVLQLGRSRTQSLKIRRSTGEACGGERSEYPEFIRNFAIRGTINHCPHNRNETISFCWILPRFPSHFIAMFLFYLRLRGASVKISKRKPLAAIIPYSWNSSLRFLILRALSFHWHGSKRETLSEAPPSHFNRPRVSWNLKKKLLIEKLRSCTNAGLSWCVRVGNS